MIDRNGKKPTNVASISENDRIRNLLENCSIPVEPGVPNYRFGDPKLWFQNVGHDFDRARIRSNKIELRKALLQKIERYRTQIEDKVTLDLLDNLQISIIRSDVALMNTAELIGVRPSEGLLARFAEIVRDSDSK